MVKSVSTRTVMIASAVIGILGLVLLFGGVIEFMADKQLHGEGLSVEGKVSRQSVVAGARGAKTHKAFLEYSGSDGKMYLQEFRIPPKKADGLRSGDMLAMKVDRDDPRRAMIDVEKVLPPEMIPIGGGAVVLAGVVALFGPGVMRKRAAMMAQMEEQHAAA